jgi:hypothetical protein
MQVAALLGRAGKPCISIESQAASHRNGAGVRRAVVSEHHKATTAVGFLATVILFFSLSAELIC